MVGTATTKRSWLLLGDQGSVPAFLIPRVLRNGRRMREGRMAAIRDMVAVRLHTIRHMPAGRTSKTTGKLKPKQNDQPTTASEGANMEQVHLEQEDEGWPSRGM